MYAGQEVRADALYFWIRYVRYMLSFVDHMDSYQLMKGIFQFPLPNSPIVKQFS